MAMIEKGMNPANTTKPKTNPSGTLRFALQAIGAASALLVGSMLENTPPRGRRGGLLLDGAAVRRDGPAVSYLIQLRQDEKEKQAREREIV
jgi:hypothetical protein